MRQLHQSPGKLLSSSRQMLAIAMHHNLSKPHVLMHLQVCERDLDKCGLHPAGIETFG